MARQKKVGTRSRDTLKSSESSFANLKTFKVTSTFLVAERPNFENVSARGYVMCIGYGRVATLPVDDPRVKVLQTKQ